MVELNFDRARPDVLLNLNEVAELRGFSREDGTVRLGAAGHLRGPRAPAPPDLLPALAEASRTVGSPDIRNRGTLGGNLGTASPAGDALPPPARGGRRGRPRQRAGRTRAAAPGVPRGAETERSCRGRARARRAGAPEWRATDVHEGRPAQCHGDRGLLRSRSSPTRERGELRAAYGSAGPVPGFVTAPLDEREGFADAVATHARPIDDVRGTAAYRRHALRGAARRRTRTLPRLIGSRASRADRQRRGSEADAWAGESLLVTCATV